MFKFMVDCPMPFLCVEFDVKKPLYNSNVVKFIKENLYSVLLSVSKGLSKEIRKQ